MLRRLGQLAYRSESPAPSAMSECSIQMTEHEMESRCSTPRPLPPPLPFEERIIERPEMAAVIGNVCDKLSTIVSLVNDFASDASGMREPAGELLDELRTKVLPYLIKLDVDMKSAEALLRFNLDRANIAENRVNWLLTFNKYQNEMRRILMELSGAVFDDLESSLELRLRGCAGRRPLSATLDHLDEMRTGMERAHQLIVIGEKGARAAA